MHTSLKFRKVVNITTQLAPVQNISVQYTGIIFSCGKTFKILQIKNAFNLFPTASSSPKIRSQNGLCFQYSRAAISSQQMKYGGFSSEQNLAMLSWRLFFHDYFSKHENNKSTVLNKKGTYILTWNSYQEKHTLESVFYYCQKWRETKGVENLC